MKILLLVFLSRMGGSGVKSCFLSLGLLSPDSKFAVRSLLNLIGSFSPVESLLDVEENELLDNDDVEDEDTSLSDCVKVVYLVGDLANTKLQSIDNRRAFSLSCSPFKWIVFSVVKDVLRFSFPVRVPPPPVDVVVVVVVVLVNSLNSPVLFNGV